eukprot:766404-Hanusia_phi.AAC.2
MENVIHLQPSKPIDVGTYAILQEQLLLNLSNSNKFHSAPKQNCQKRSRASNFLPHSPRYFAGFNSITSRQSFCTI